MARLENKVAIITGASSGIGRAAALLFAREGARVVVSARREPELAALAEEIAAAGGEAAVLAGDVADPGCASALVELAEARFGGLDVAFNNAGSLGAGAPVTELTLEQWRATLDVNLTGAFLGAKAQIPAMLRRGGGSVIFTGTFVGKTAALPNMVDYAASKSGLIGLSQALAVEYGPQAIRVNALLPGGVDTPMGRQSASTPEVLDFVRGMHALKRIGAPEEIAKAALFLASDEAAFVTGSAFFADGGVSVSRG